MRRSDLPAKAVTRFVIKTASSFFAGKSDRRTARSYKGGMVIVQPR